ncbi:MAG TPA: TRAP transporter large permease [Syntrophorhabdus sp.]|mgnify:FL=1|jgi:tripartite ATP-independent transporter DctM subunit|nr:TRAP transporter large permease [Syntrophorhabdus sp.]OPX98886.1 MAG: Sialic acid TRAP transporter permease protein SiaT [Syntrophorhabdus sp. PtaB.Bin027]MBP8744829.1 TRAP transporter large permease [Syntrophorhabdus sp.]NMC94272.1 TRAP transporter large permease [Syntrophorhabdus sp.]HQG24929.1 TRAP transporter large permease [Syntrophorhabdus sp.]
MNEVTAGIVFLIILLLLFGTGIELGFGMALVGMVGFAYLNGWTAAMQLVGRDIYDVITNYGYTVFPLFILMGQIGFNAGIAVRLYDAAHKFIGHIPGGLAMATVMGATGFKAICGSSAATSATFASVAIPEMNRFGYDKKLSTGIVATVGTLGCIIPPSVVLIIFGVITEQSIGKLFMAGIIPGLLIALFFLGVIYGWAKVNPKIAPKSDRFPWSDKIRSLPEIIWVLLVFCVVVGGIMTGFFTPTEAGAVGTFAILVLAFIKKDLKFSGYTKSVTESLRTAGMILMLIAGSVILGHFIAVTNIPQKTAEWLVDLPLHRNLIMLLICLIYLFGGSFIDDLAFMILATPIFYPAVDRLGFDPIWFGIVIAITVAVGVVIPPVAVCVFVVKNITKVPMGEIYKGVLPFLISLIFVGILLFIFPQLALWLPAVLFR